MRFRTAAVSVVALAAVAGLVSAAPSPAAPSQAAPSQASDAGTGAGARAAAVHGAARVLYAYASPDDEIRFAVDAEAAPYTRPFVLDGERQPGMPVDAKGKVTVYHRVAADGSLGTSEAEVDCLVTGDGVATLTAVVTKSNVWEQGDRFGISVQDGRRGGPDRLGFSWGVANIDPGREPFNPRVGTCMAPAPFATVTEGGFEVASAPLPPLRG
ncbi:hypothetical protein [Streptomyces bambusae]|uniref:Repetin n=1 Tax=Streptomyces bambusae TaxID=1550616 RepID=A0ABS6ZCT8_9ACTN|nr:hypothetical protein [Streptomyces bambusae]MBW5485572.1 hypothetical protein [Streptomyces bambusae]